MAAATFIAFTASYAPNDIAPAPGALMPGMPNLLSHAFQRAMASLTDYRAKPYSEREHGDLAVACALRNTPCREHVIRGQVLPRLASAARERVFPGMSRVVRPVCFTRFW